MESVTTVKPGSFFPGVLRDPRQEIGIERVGADDGVRLELVDQIRQRRLDPAHDRRALLAEVAVVGGAVDSRPDVREMRGHVAVAAG